eukprot:2616045-Prymnesium_polylepis.1
MQVSARDRLSSGSASHIYGCSPHAPVALAEHVLNPLQQCSCFNLWRRERRGDIKGAAAAGQGCSAAGAAQ